MDQTGTLISSCVNFALLSLQGRIRFFVKFHSYKKNPTPQMNIYQLLTNIRIYHVTHAWQRGATGVQRSSFLIDAPLARTDLHIFATPPARKCLQSQARLWLVPWLSGYTSKSRRRTYNCYSSRDRERTRRVVPSPRAHTHTHSLTGEEITEQAMAASLLGVSSRLCLIVGDFKKRNSLFLKKSLIYCQTSRRITT